MVKLPRDILVVKKTNFTLLLKVMMVREHMNKDYNTIIYVEQNLVQTDQNMQNVKKNGFGIK